ncbi:MAG: hypothetical protein HY858_00985 [Candidatus Solibacter usitatus]|nr:hypothetical protein [Candidatus Solibacter usitatus]
MRNWIHAVAFCGLLAAPSVAERGPARVLIAADAGLDAPARHGLEQLRASLEARGLAVEAAAPSRDSAADFVVLAGLSSGGEAVRALVSSGGSRPAEPQALAVRKVKFRGKPALVLCGSDGRGLMYAALDTAERVAWAGEMRDPFAAVRDVDERPYLAERGISMYTMQRAYFESRLYDEQYWRRHFDLLARSRINTFTVIFGYENGGFMAPPYPYFFNVAGYPEVRLAGISRAQQEKNSAAFRALIRIARERGVDVIAAIWDHIYRGGVQGGGIPGASELAGKDTPGLVTGLRAETLGSYTQAALAQFLGAFPELAGLEFRMHGESGLKRDEMGPFWHAVFQDLARAKPGMRITLRAKELPDEIIHDALKQGLQARVETKYWMEQMGLPFHPTHVNRQNQKDRRHGYADLLRYPQRYRVHWRLWSGGTARLLLWGDPEYARRYAESARLYGGNSIDVNEMLATKMLGEPHDRAPLPVLQDGHRYYDYEFERYWHFYQVWGRVAYNPATPAEVWEREFRRRLGAAGPSLMQGLHAASKVLPRIIAASYRYQLFPTTRGWAEMMRQEDLPKFAELEGTDIEQFMNPRDAARGIISGAAASKRRPEETSRWFRDLSEKILKHVHDAEAAGLAGNEAKSTVVDLSILAGLARYHAARLRAAVSYNLYRETGDTDAFDEAIQQERSAVEAWKEMVQSAGDTYADELAFGVHAVGFPRHWKEELQKLEQGLRQLAVERERARQRPVGARRRREPPQGAAPRVELNAVASAYPGMPLTITVRTQDAAAVQSVRLRYRHLTQYEDYQTVEMQPAGGTGTYRATIPGAFITTEWDVMYFVEVVGQNGEGRNYPDLEVEAPYVIVPVARGESRAGGG